MKWCKTPMFKIQIWGYEAKTPNEFGFQFEILAQGLGMRFLLGIGSQLMNNTTSLDYLIDYFLKIILTLC